jgi:type II secretory pathway component GspD/PulD (secretin)
MSRQQSLIGSPIHALRLACGICLAAVVVLALVDSATGQERREGAPADQKALAQKERIRRGPPRSEQEKGKPAEKSGASVESQPAKPQEGAKPEQQPATTEPVDKQLVRTTDGKYRFSFQGQPWLEVLQWLARNSKLTLDWQELPDDKLNLTTQTSYTLDEARDLFNMHLAARGFTLLRRGEILGVVKLDKLNPALVPRVEPGELDSRDPHEIVRVSFPLEWLVASEAVKEFEPMKSSFGKLTAMAATNRLEALDIVDNLLEIREMLNREQSPQGEERLVVEFKLKHVRAEDIMSKLQTLVGSPGAMLRPQDRARMQMMQMRGRGGDSDRDRDNNNNNNNNRNAPPKEPEVHLVVNEQENSILANAPPDKLAVVRQAVQALDVPSSAGNRGSDAMTRMRIYRTKGIDPEPMADLIQELVSLGKLATSTQVQADDNSNTLIVYATPSDHMAIANLVDQIGDTGRDVRIIALAQLTPDYALQAIKLLLQGEQPESGGFGSFGGYGGDWGGRRRRGGGGGNSNSGDDQFRIEADSERNRLLLWATDTEYEQVKGLLAKLGEQGGAGAVRGNLRILSMPSRGSEQALESLQQIWPHLRTNPLEIRGRGSASEPSSRRATESSSSEKTGEPRRENRTAAAESSSTNDALAPSRRKTVLPAAITVADTTAGESDQSDNEPPQSGEEVALADESAEIDALAQADKTDQGKEQANDQPQSNGAERPEADKAEATPAPAVKAGRDDGAAAPTAPRRPERRSVRNDVGRQLARSDAAQPPAITITEGPGGQLIVTSEDLDALDAVEKLIAQITPKQADYEIFRLQYASPYAIELTLSQIFGLDSQTGIGGRSSSLPIGSRPALQFISDVETGTLLVQGASAEQLQKIGQLIDLYDQPESQHKDLQRKTEIYEMRFSRAEAVAEVVKEVYRDLLSSNDRAFSRDRREGEGRNSDVGYGSNYVTRIPQFRGLLSIGIESTSNTLVVSAPEYLINDVMQLVRNVDERSAGHKVQVLQVNGVGTEALRSVLARIPGITTSTPAGTSRSNAGPGGGGPGGGPNGISSSRALGSSGDNDQARQQFNRSFPSRGEFRGFNGGSFNGRGGFNSRSFENSGRGNGSSRRGGRD